MDLPEVSASSTLDFAKLPPPFNELKEGDIPYYTGSQVLELVKHFGKLDQTNHILWNLIQKQRYILAKLQEQLKKTQPAAISPPIATPSTTVTTADVPSTNISVGNDAEDHGLLAQNHQQQQRQPSEGLERDTAPAGGTSSSEFAPYPSDLDAATRHNLSGESGPSKNRVELISEAHKSMRLSDIYDHYTGGGKGEVHGQDSEVCSTDPTPVSQASSMVLSASTHTDRSNPTESGSSGSRKSPLNHNVHQATPPLPAQQPTQPTLSDVPLPHIPGRPSSAAAHSGADPIFLPSTAADTGMLPLNKVRLMPPETSPFTRPARDRRPQTSRVHASEGELVGGSESSSFATPESLGPKSNAYHPALPHTVGKWANQPPHVPSSNPDVTAHQDTAVYEKYGLSASRSIASLRDVTTSAAPPSTGVCLGGGASSISYGPDTHRPQLTSPITSQPPPLQINIPPSAAATHGQHHRAQLPYHHFQNPPQPKQGSDPTPALLAGGANHHGTPMGGSGTYTSDMGYNGRINYSEYGANNPSSSPTDVGPHPNSPLASHPGFLGLHKSGASDRVAFPKLSIGTKSEIEENRLNDNAHTSHRHPLLSHYHHQPHSYPTPSSATRSPTTTAPGPAPAPPSICRTNRSVTGAPEYYLNPKLQPFVLPLNAQPLSQDPNPAKVTTSHTQHSKSLSNPEERSVPSSHRPNRHHTEMTQAEPHQHQEEGSRTAGKPTSHIRQNSPDTMSYNYPQNNDSIYSLGESVRSQHTVNQSLLSLRQSCADTIGEAEVLPSLTGINIEVKSSRLELDKRGNQVIIFLIDVFEIKEPAGSVTSTDAQTELGKRKIWVLKKLYSDFLTLDNEIRRWSGDTIDVQSLPDTPALRKAHSKDFRKKLLEDYLKWAIRSAAECESLKKFLSTNIVDEAKTMYYKEGFLFKTGRNLGGLKRRYYVTNPAEKTLEYYDKPGGSRVGVIPLEGAVVKTERCGDHSESTKGGHGPPARTKLDKGTKQFRHALLIEEKPKRLTRESTTHVLKATTDKERDEWVAVIINIIRSLEEKPADDGSSGSGAAQDRKPIFKRLRPSLSKGSRDFPDNAGPGPHNTSPKNAIAPAAPIVVGSSDGKSRMPGTPSGAYTPPSSAAVIATVTAGGPTAPKSTSKNDEKGYGGNRPRSLSYPPPRLNLNDKNGFNNGQVDYHSSTQSSKIQRRSHRSHTSLVSIDTQHERSKQPALAEPSSSAGLPNREELALGDATTASPPDHSGDYEAHKQTPLSEAEGEQPAVRSDVQKPQKKLAPLEQLLQGKSVGSGLIKDGFHKDSIGRIRRDVKEEKHSLSNIETPHVTDDILGIGRKKQEQLSSSMVMVKYKGDDKMVAATKDEKKRGRINFAWGRSKKNTKSSKAPGSGPATNEPPVQHKVPMMPVFGLMLELAVQATKVKEHYELPAVVYRCIEYLDAKKAYTEEGIYRLSGSSVEIEKLKTKFNTRRDYNLLEAGEIYDVHVIAGLLKLYLRELPTSVLTPTLHHDFVRVVDLADRDARVHEMGRLVSDLPLANYTILRSLIAHLIRVVQHEKINKMSQYVIGIVISPSIGIPVGVFNLLMSEFEYIFWVNDEGVPSPRRISGGLVKVKTPGSAHDATPLSVPAPVPQGQPPRQSNEDPTAAKQLSISFKGSAENSLSHANGWDETSEEECVSDSEELARRYEHQKARLTRRIEGMPFNIANGQWPTFDESVDSDFEKFRQRIAKQQVEEFGEEEEGEGEGIDGGGGGGKQQHGPHDGKVAPEPSQELDEEYLLEERSGRTNRNSRQYAVGAPDELLRKEANLRLPSGIDFDSIDDAILLSHKSNSSSGAMQ